MTIWDAPQTSSPYSFSAPVRQRAEAYSVTAFVFCLCSLFVPVVPAFVSVFMARAGRKNIAASPTTRRGRGLGIAATVISVLHLLAVVSIVFVIWYSARR